MMQVEICDTAMDVSALAYELVAQTVRAMPHAVIGFPTGTTPMALYERMISGQRNGDVDFRGIRVFNLDEYVGLGPDHPQSYHRYLRHNLLDELQVPEARIALLDGLASDFEAHCAAYEDRIARAGGIDLQILGIGTNGHMAFNEPGCSLGSRTGVRLLARSTRLEHGRAFDHGDDVPGTALSLGVATIMEAKRMLLLCTGAHKAQAVRGAIEGPVTAMVPMSALQWHPCTTVLLDRLAASQLELDHDDGLAEPK